MSKRHVVIVGAGFGGLRCARELAGTEGVEITVIDRNPYQLFAPLLVGLVKPTLTIKGGPDAAQYELVKINGLYYRRWAGNGFKLFSTPADANGDNVLSAGGGEYNPLCNRAVGPAIAALPELLAALRDAYAYATDTALGDKPEMDAATLAGIIGDALGKAGWVAP